MGEFAHYGELVSVLKQSVKDRTTGTLFIRTDNNRSVMVGLDRGEIVMLACGVKRGLDAVPEIRAIRGGSYRLTSSAIDIGASALPPTADLLRMLEGTQPAAPPSPGGAPRAAEGGAESDARPAVDLLRKIFSEFIGPIGIMVFEGVLKRLGAPRGAEEIERLIEALAGELGDPGEASRFKQTARARLKGLRSG